MTPSYRIDLLRPGQSCALWVTRDATLAGSPGIFAIGELTSLPYLDAGDPTDTLWRDRSARDQVRPYVGTTMSVLVEPICADELREDPACARAEIFRAPRMGSPLAFDHPAWSVVLARR